MLDILNFICFLLKKKFNKDVKDSDWITYSFGNMKTEFGVRFIIRVILLYTLIMNGKQN